MTPFRFESDLERYLVEHLELLEPGLKLYEGKGKWGINYQIGTLRMDILAVDRKGGLVVIELKSNRGLPSVLGQLLGYMVAIRRGLAKEGQRVRGFIVCRWAEEHLLWAAAEVPGISVFEFYRGQGWCRVLGEPLEG